MYISTHFEQKAQTTKSKPQGKLQTRTYKSSHNLINTANLLLIKKFYSFFTFTWGRSVKSLARHSPNLHSCASLALAARALENLTVSAAVLKIYIYNVEMYYLSHSRLCLIAKNARNKPKTPIQQITTGPRTQLQTQVATSIRRIMYATS